MQIAFWSTLQKMMDNSDHQENEVAVVNESETVKVTKTSCANSDKRAKWTRLAKTMLINLSFMIGLVIQEKRINKEQSNSSFFNFCREFAKVHLVQVFSIWQKFMTPTWTRWLFCS